MINSMDGYCAFFPTEDEAIDHCRLVNRAIRATHPLSALCAVIDGPEDNYAVVDIPSAEEILDYPDSGIPYLIVTD